MKFKILTLMSLLTLNSCAIGSAAAAYSLMSVQADGLSSNAEKDLVSRVKDEIYRENVLITRIKVIPEEIEEYKEKTCAE